MDSITIIASSYFPETCAPAKRLHGLAKHLAGKGHKVTVIAPLPNYPQGRVYKEFQTKLAQEFHEDGVRIIRLMPIIAPKDKLLLRLIAEVLSAFLASGVYLIHARSSIVLASSPAIFLGPFGALVAKLTGAKFMWDIRDLLWRYTQAIGETGLRKVAGNLIEGLMLWTARQARFLTATTKSQQDYFVQHGVAESRTALYPNGIPEAFFERVKAAQPRKKRPGTFRVVYAGLIGYPQGLTTLITAAKLLGDDPSIEILLAGDGVERATLESRCQVEGIGNVQFLGYLSQQELAELYRSADILYAQLRGEPVFATAQPSKVWEYLATGNPLVYGGIGESANAVRRSGGGLVVPPDDPAALVTTLRLLKDDPDLRKDLAAAGWDFASIHLKQETILAEVTEKLLSVGGMHSPKALSNIQPEVIAGALSARPDK